MVLPTASGSAPVDRELPGAKSKAPMDIGGVAFEPVGLKMMIDARSSLRSRDSHVGWNLRKARDRAAGSPLRLRVPFHGHDLIFRRETLISLTLQSSKRPVPISAQADLDDGHNRMCRRRRSGHPRVWPQRIRCVAEIETSSERTNHELALVLLRLARQSTLHG